MHHSYEGDTRALLVCARFASCQLKENGREEFTQEAKGRKRRERRKKEAVGVWRSPCNQRCPVPELEKPAAAPGCLGYGGNPASICPRGQSTSIFLFLFVFLLSWRSLFPPFLSACTLQLHTPHALGRKLQVAPPADGSKRQPTSTSTPSRRW